MTVRDVVLKAIAEVAYTDTERLVDSMSLEDDLRLDDLDMCEVAFGIEELLNIEIEEGDESHWETVGDVVAYVERMTP